MRGIGMHYVQTDRADGNVQMKNTEPDLLSPELKTRTRLGFVRLPDEFPEALLNSG